MYVGNMKKTERVLRIPLVIKNRPSFLIPVQRLPANIKVKITGQQRKIVLIEKKQLSAVIDMSSATRGQNFFNVNLNHQDFAADIAVSATVKRLKIDMDFLREKILPIRARILNQPANGFEIKTYKVNPAYILVQGARSVLKNVRELYTHPVNISGIRSSMTKNIRIDTKNLNIRFKNRTQITLNITVTEKMVNKLFTKVPVLLEGLAAGFKPKKAERNFSSVTVSGRKSLVDAINANLLLLSADLSKIKKPGTYTIRFSIKPYPGVKIEQINPPSISIEVVKE